MCKNRNKKVNLNRHTNKWLNTKTAVNSLKNTQFDVI